MRFWNTRTLALIQKEKLPSEGERGLAVYLDADLGRKVYSINLNSRFRQQESLLLAEDSHQAIPKLRAGRKERLHRTCCSDRRAISLAFLLAKTLIRPFFGLKKEFGYCKKF